MSFSLLEQPRELIVNEQLVRLPIEDLIATCKSNPQLNRICQGKDVWIARIQAEYPELNIRDIENPREFYLRQSLFGGQIYFHYTDGDKTTDIKELQPETIAYDKLFARVQYIAESLLPQGKDYYIVYSRPGSQPDFSQFDRAIELIPRLDVIAYQTRDNVYIEPGPALKITLVDIIYVEPNSSTLQVINQIRKLKDIPDPGRGQNVIIDGAQVSRMVWFKLIRALERELRLISYDIIDIHKTFNTPFYQRELDFLQEKTAIKNPIIPSINSVLSNVDISIRKKKILDKIMDSIDQVKFQEYLDSERNNFGNNASFSGFKTYDEFDTFQEDYINGLNDKQVETIELLINQILPITRVYNTRIATNPVNAFLFDLNGRIILNVAR